jgi:uncharacterized protein YcfL
MSIINLTYKTRSKDFVIFSLLFLLLGACSPVYPVKERDSRITIIDIHLRALISIKQITTNLQADGLKQVQVTGMSHAESYMKLEYKVEWLDRMGIVIPSVMSNWTEFPVHQRAEFRFKMISPNSSANDFRILIRQG